MFSMHPQFMLFTARTHRHQNFQTQTKDFSFLAGLSLNLCSFIRFVLFLFYFSTRYVIRWSILLCKRNSLWTMNYELYQWSITGNDAGNGNGVKTRVMSAQSLDYWYSGVIFPILSTTPFPFQACHVVRYLVDMLRRTVSRNGSYICHRPLTSSLVRVVD